MTLPFPLILDGGFATELERQFGKDLRGRLWSAKCLDEDPEAIKAVHISYFEAGANVATTCSYQATIEGFLEEGFSQEEAVGLMKKSVQLAREARDAYKHKHPDDTESRLIALSMGCYGAKLANGAEYTGDYGNITKQDLIHFHKDRLLLFLQEPGIDLILFETIPSALEAEAIKELIKTWKDETLPPIGIAFSCKSDSQISDGTNLEECIGYYDNLEQVVAIGVNCTSLKYITSLVTILADKQRQTNKAVLVYPNSGAIWDAEERRWVSDSKLSMEMFYESMANAVEKCGTKVMIGGCCGTQVNHIQYLREKLFI
ncbi:Homocysteine S-methyltransferase [Halteromyces radiatus]|uniref:Homocysteine S-methyltransferase n=1 Tax=Halteromyces radiatus TaxID=101107 RepID=UPI00221E51CD|nr:Homocysteine S-methyltransferase [Halteromyces radiatus]KAI8089663.1 Homocysteine S-methyltransferase [Halteromyces radiatus]